MSADRPASLTPGRVEWRGKNIVDKPHVGENNCTSANADHGSMVSNELATDQPESHKVVAESIADAVDIALHVPLPESADEDLIAEEKSDALDKVTSAPRRPVDSPLYQLHLQRDNLHLAGWTPLPVDDEDLLDFVDQCDTTAPGQAKTTFFSDASDDGFDRSALGADHAAPYEREMTDYAESLLGSRSGGHSRSTSLR